MKFDEPLNTLFILVGIQTVLSRLLSSFYFFEYPLIKNYFFQQHINQKTATLETVIEPKINILIILITTWSYILSVGFYVGVDILQFVAPKTIVDTLITFFFPIQNFVQSQDMHLSFTAKCFGLILFEIGALLMLWTHLVLGYSFSPLIDLKEGSLVRTGPFKYVRHPMYLSIFIIVNGMALSSSNYCIFFTGNFLFISLWILRLYSEEECLIQKFGKQYIVYKQTTKNRIFPFLY